MRLHALTITPDKRRNMRVPCDHWFYFTSDTQPEGYFGAANASQNGLFLKGAFQAKVGDNCCLELRKRGRGVPAPLSLQGRILRKEPQGVGIRFTHVEERSFMMLQAMLLYASEDPVTLAEHFEECFA